MIRPLAALMVLSLATLACSEPSTSPEPPLGYIRLIVQTTGNDVDDSFEITSDTTKAPIGANTQTTLALLEGLHTLTLSSVADNCIVTGNATLSVGVSKNDTVEVVFHVECMQTGIDIVTHTTGHDLPPGFQIVLSTSLTTVIAPNATFSVSRLPVARYQVTLRLGAPNCTVAGDSVLAIDVVNRQMTRAQFNIQCVFTPLTGVIAFVDGNANIKLIDADGSNPKTVIYGWSPSWSRDRTKIVYSDVSCEYYTNLCSGSLKLFDLATRDITVLDQARNGIQPDWSPTDDVIAYTDAVTGRLYLYNVTASTTRLIDSGDRLVYHPSWSPDGSQLVAQCSGATAPPPNLCIIDRDGAVKNIDTEAYVENPTWSPDGSQITFSTFEDRTTRIAVINADGTGLRKLASGFTPSWSPDSKQIIFGTTTGLFVINVDGSALSRLTNGPYHYSPAWRP